MLMDLECMLLTGRIELSGGLMGSTEVDRLKGARSSTIPVWDFLYLPSTTEWDLRCRRAVSADSLLSYNCSLIVG